MEKTQLNQLITFLDEMEKSETNLNSVLAIKTIKIKVYSMISDERKQIESAFDFGKKYQNTESSMYYFMKYIDND